MATPRQDPTFQPAKHVFGFSLPGQAVFGRDMPYPQRAVFGQRSFGSQIAGFCTEDEMFRFLNGSPSAKTPYWKKGSWHTAVTPWPSTSFMAPVVRGRWISRCFFHTGGKYSQVRRLTPAMSAAKEHLVPAMLDLMAASVVWHTFGASTRRQLDIDASKLGLHYTGYNYFTKLYIKDDPKWMTYV
jgi:hypothetical protein